MNDQNLKNLKNCLEKHEKLWEEFDKGLDKGKISELHKFFMDKFPALKRAAYDCAVAFHECTKDINSLDHCLCAAGWKDVPNDIRNWAKDKHGRSAEIADFAPCEFFESYVRKYNIQTK